MNAPTEAPPRPADRPTVPREGRAAAQARPKPGSGLAASGGEEGAGAVSDGAVPLRALELILRRPRQGGTAEGRGDAADSIAEETNGVTRRPRTSDTAPQAPGEPSEPGSPVADRAAGRAGNDLDQAQLATIVEATNDAIIGLSLDGTITNWNPAAERLYGFAENEAIGKSIELLAPPGEPDDMPRFLEQIARGERIDEHRTRRRTKGEDVLDLLLSIAPIRTAGGAVIGASAIVRDVTDRTRAEVALRETEERFRAFMDHQPAVAYMKDAAGRYVYVNRPWERVFRRSFEEMRGQTDDVWLPPEALRQIRENDRAVLEANAPIQVVESAPLLDGTVRSWLSVKFPFADADGRRFVGGVSIDITDRQRADELRHRQARHAALRAEVSAALAERGPTTALLSRCADAIHDGLDADRVTIWLLDEAEQMLELQASVGATGLPASGRDRVPVGSFRVGRVAQERRPILSNDLAADRQPGDQGWASQAGLVAFAGLPLLAEDRLVGVVAVFAREPLNDDTLEALATVADAIAQGTERKRAQLALAAERDLLQSLMDALPDPVYVKDADSRYVRLNRATAGLLGVDDPDVAIGKSDADFYPAPLARRFVADDGRVLASGEPLLNRLEPQTEDEAAGAVVLTSRVPLRDAAGDVVGLIGAARDVTERHRLDQERAAAHAAQREYAGRLEELSGLRADFGRMVAHELGSPIAAIGFQASMIGTGELDQAEVLRAVSAIQAEVAHLGDLVGDVRDMATVERDGFTVRPRPVLLDDLLLDAAGSNRALPGEHPLLTTIAAQGQVLADPERIDQVLRNLIGNAAKYTPPGTPIELRAMPEPDRVRIEVADRGPGVHPDDVERIFDKFGRAREHHGGHIPGVGLGLYLSRRIVGAHGCSDLTLHETPGGGATFSFALDRVE